MRHETPSGGFHLFFNTDREFRPGVNQLGPGIDVRGTDSYVVAPPSVTPSKVTGELNPYQGHRESFIGNRHHVAWMPDDMHEALLQRHMPTAHVDRPRDPRALRLLDTGDSVADKAREGWIWADELEADDWTYVRRHDGDSEWTRPDKNPRHGTSATLHGDGEARSWCGRLSLPEGGLPTRRGAVGSYQPVGLHRHVPLRRGHQGGCGPGRAERGRTRGGRSRRPPPPMATIRPSVSCRRCRMSSGTIRSTPMSWRPPGLAAAGPTP